MFKYDLMTNQEKFYNITTDVQDAVNKSNVKNGICVVFCPHTTAAITINENADEYVWQDIIKGSKHAFPQLESFQHDEGNSTGHIKSSMFGCSETVIIEDGKLILGRWQDIYFAEFDPPRTRQFFVKIIEG